MQTAHPQFQLLTFYCSTWFPLSSMQFLQRFTNFRPSFNNRFIDGDKFLSAEHFSRFVNKKLSPEANGEYGGRGSIS